MKIASMIMGCVAASKSSVFTLNGGETLDQLDTMLATVTNGTVDDIEAQISLFQLARTNRQEAPTIAEQRKFRNLKILVLWLQKEQKFGRYCYYGCHCLPEGSHNIAQGGYGKPLDNIDGACKRFGQCYKCLIDEHKDDGKEINGQSDCIGEEIGYAADLLIDDVTGQKSLQCSNKLGSCRRNICECDKQLAEGLSKYEDEWDESLHANRGGFEREQSCHRPQGYGGHKFVECCGSKTTFPFNTPRNEAQCCNGPKAENSAPDANGKCY